LQYLTSTHLPTRAYRRDTSLAGWMLRLALVALAYFVSGLLGLALSRDATAVSLFWAPSGVALAAVVAWGPLTAPAIFAASAAISLTAGHSAIVSVGEALGSTAAAVLASLALKRLGFRPMLDRRRDLALLLAIGAVAASLLSATNGVLWLAFGGLIETVGLTSTWLVWWLGDALGVAIVAVPLISLVRRPWHDLRRDVNLAVPLALAVSVLAAVLVVFLSRGPAAGVATPWLFVPHVLLAALAARGGLFLTSTTVLGVAVAISGATAAGWGPFAQPQITDSLPLLWGYLGSLCATGLITTALSREIAVNEERWQLALEGADLGVADWDTRRGRGFRSRRWLALLGDADPANGERFDDWLARVHPEDNEAFRADLRALDNASCDRLHRDVRLRIGDGTWRWFACDVLVAERSADDKPARLVATLCDVTSRRSARERERLSAHLFQSLHEGVLIADAQCRVLDVNPMYCALTGETRDTLMGTVPDLLRPPAPAEPRPEGDAARAELWRSLEASGAWRGEIVDTGPDGQPRALQISVATVRRRDLPRYITVVLSDVTEQHRQRQQLERQAHFDDLTGLPNRTRLAQLLADAIEASNREGFLLAVCYIDLDHFKAVNDRHGHAAGDQVLVELATRLRAGLRRGGNWVDSAARLSGDEFVLLMRASSLDEARQAVERMLELIARPYAIAGVAEPVEVSASIGATVYPLDQSDAETLIRHADHAMYGAKQGGRDGYLFFDAEQSRRTEAHVVAVGRIQEALQQGELELYFQPKVNMRTGRVHGVEALLRWIHPEHGIIGPSGFLPLIEHTVLGASVGDWVLEQGIAQLVRWLDAGLDVSVSINVSARHLQAPDFVSRLEQLLAPHRPQVAARLELEVLETAALADVDYTSKLMERCRARGVRFALDDFGTGYSNLTYLKRLPVDVLKIDRSFVHGMLTDAENLAIVEGVVRLARTFNCMAVAEGVESAEQARKLLSVGCEIGQGVGIASPMPAGEIMAWAREHRGILAGPRVVAL
jgi:diguanylate cyclase (GGDEF)-like protein/PAS domain S-box-containing protein